MSNTVSKPVMLNLNTPHHIHTYSPAQLNLIKQEIHKMLEQNILEPSTSPWGAPCLLVKKKTEHGLQVAPRLVWDYRKLNKVTKPDVYPLPHVQMILDQLGGKTWFTKLDLFSGFWHIPIAAQDKEKTAVITHVGLYQFKKLPFGLRNAPASFQRLMNCTFADMLFPADEQPYLSTYVDDILCHSTNWRDHLVHLERVLARCDQVALSLKPSMCSFANQSQEFLGYVISEQIIGPDNKEHPVRYASRALQPPESKWTTREQELLAVIWACETCHSIVIFGDANSLSKQTMQIYNGFKP